MFPPTTWKGQSCPEDLALAGRYVRLVPLHLEHSGDLFRAGSNPEIWSYVAEQRSPFSSVSDSARWIEHALNEKSTGSRLPFALISAYSGKAIGSTSYFAETRWANRTLEIGGTWIDPRHWRTAVNTESKHLLLGYAFDTLGARRVEFLTDSRNERSLRALQRIGAHCEGILREHMICVDGSQRSSVCLSILAGEWPATRAKLETSLGR